MWILPALSCFALFITGGYGQGMAELMRNPFMLRALMSPGGGRGGAPDLTTLAMLNPQMMEGGGMGQIMMLDALRNSGGSGSGSQLMNMALLNPEMLNGVLPAGAAGNPAMMYYLFSQNQDTATPTPTAPAAPGNRTGASTPTKPSGPDFGKIMQMMALTGGSSEMANMGAMAALMSGSGSGPLSPMNALRPGQFSSLMREGAAAHPQYAQRLCRPPVNCKMPLCAEPITTYSRETYFVCPDCRKCPHDLMMEMLNPGGITGAGANPAGRPPVGSRRGPRRNSPVGNSPTKGPVGSNVIPPGSSGGQGAVPAGVRSLGNFVRGLGRGPAA